jgi:hypothetical protein
MISKVNMLAILIKNSIVLDWPDFLLTACQRQIIIDYPCVKFRDGLRSLSCYKAPAEKAITYHLIQRPPADLTAAKPGSASTVAELD